MGKYDLANTLGNGDYKVPVFSDKNNVIPNLAINGNGNIQAGRDVNVTIKKTTTMSELISLYKKEKESNDQISHCIDALNHLISPNDNGLVIGLEKKLEMGHFGHMKDFALQTKERFAKKMALYTFSESAQEIFAYVLGDVMCRFQNKIYPHIIANKPKEEITSLIQDEVIEPIKSLLEENIFKLFALEINGMVYFLTGNCHIKWSK